MKRSSIIVSTTLIVVFLIVIKLYCALYGNPYTLYKGEKRVINYLINCKQYKEKNITIKDLYSQATKYKYFYRVKIKNQPNMTYNYGIDHNGTMILYEMEYMNSPIVWKHYSRKEHLVSRWDYDWRGIDDYLSSKGINPYEQTIQLGYRYYNITSDFIEVIFKDEPKRKYYYLLSKQGNLIQQKYVLGFTKFKKKYLLVKDESKYINSISAEIKISKKSISSIQKVYGKLTVLKDYTVVILHDKPNVEYYYGINNNSDEYRQMFTKRYLKY